MVLRLAEQLDVPLRERNRLLLAAGFAPRYAERPLGGDALPAVGDAVKRVLRAHEPYPALVLDRRWNIVMTNRAVGPFLADVAADVVPELLRPPINLLRLGLDPRGLARSLGQQGEPADAVVVRCEERVRRGEIGPADSRAPSQPAMKSHASRWGRAVTGSS